MQFIPSTWRTAGVDADNDTIKDPHDIDDAALAAANYLCSGARNLATPSGWWSAILSYNDVRQLRDGRVRRGEPTTAPESRCVIISALMRTKAFHATAVRGKLDR